MNLDTLYDIKKKWDESHSEHQRITTLYYLIFDNGEVLSAQMETQFKVVWVYGKKSVSRRVGKADEPEENSFNTDHITSYSRGKNAILF